MQMTKTAVLSHLSDGLVPLPAAPSEVALSGSHYVHKGLKSLKSFNQKKLMFFNIV